jgi:hypothetical protein
MFGWQSSLRRRALAMIAFAMTAAGLSAQSRPVDPAALVLDADVRAALDAAKASERQTIDDQVRFCEIPAPPFKEAARGE